MIHQSQIPRDIATLLQWANITRRLAQFASENRRSIITIQIITDERGLPVAWSQPEKSKLEPKGT